jgi:RNA recognition motif-containing protein
MSCTEARIVMDQNSRRTKGYGFVTFRNHESASRALSKNGEILKGRKMRVNWATTTKDSKPPAQSQFSLPDGYGQASTSELVRLAAADGLDVNWFMNLPQDTQAGILRVSSEANGAARVVWIGNLDKNATRTAYLLLSD